MADAAMTFLEFFAGGGMAREGLGPNWACLFANDIDPKKGAAYTANWAADRFIMGDVGTLTVADLPGGGDLASASPPCQDVSLAGDRPGLDAARSGAVWPFVKFMWASRRAARSTCDSRGERHRLADVAWRQGLRRGLRRSRRVRLSCRRGGDRCCVVRPAVARACVHHRRQL